MTTLTLIHHLATSSPSVADYWHYLSVLQHMHHLCGIVSVSDDSTTASTVLYGGNCVQAFVTALQMHDPNVSFVSDAVSAAQAGVTGIFGY